MDDTILYDVAQIILACARDALDETFAGAPEKSYVVIGTPAHDDCCADGGQLTITLTRQYASTQFPSEDITQVQCGPAFTALDLDVEIVRCHPSIDELGRAPTIEEMENAAQTAYVDMLTVWNAVACCLIVMREQQNWSSVMRRQVPISPEGGCAGSRLSITIGLTRGCECG